jgi:sigma-B regulation protein RsbU (phosphoserine phosphatase)
MSVVPEIGSLSAEQVKLVLDVSRTLAITTDLNVLLGRIAQAATQLLACERASIFVHDPVTDELWTKVAVGSGEIRMPASAGIAGSSFTTNSIVLVADVYGDARFHSGPDEASGFRTRDILSSPMQSIEGKAVGVIQAINKSDGGFDSSDVALVRLLSDQAGVAIQRYQLQVEAMAAVGLRKEMDLARRVQEAMLPKMMPQVHGVEVMGWTRSASVTGGDCYDFWEMKDGRLGILVADASGHGLAPTIIVSQVRTLVRALCDGECDPGKLLELVNARVAEDIEPDRFVTVFLGMLSREGVLNYASAGHGPLLCRGGKGEGLRELETTHPPVGVMRELVGDSAEAVKLLSGGGLIVVSDGIFEASNAAGEMFGMRRVLSVLEDACDAPAGEMIARLRDEVMQWQGAGDPRDDQTVVVCRRV